MSGAGPPGKPEPNEVRRFPDIWTTIRSAGLDLGTENVFKLPVPEEPEVTPADTRKKMRRILFTFNQRQVLLKWLKDHQDNPYPTSHEKDLLMMTTGLNREQINVWFTNNRARHGMTGRSRKSTTSAEKVPQFLQWTPHNL